MAKTDDCLSPKPAGEGSYRKVILGTLVEIFRDPETENRSEGYAKVWAILEEDDMFYTLVVSFMDDPASPSRKFTRKYKKWE